MSLFEPQSPSSPDLARRTAVAELRALADVYRQAATQTSTLATIATFQSCAEVAERRADQLQNGAKLHF